MWNFLGILYAKKLLKSVHFRRVILKIKRGVVFTTQCITAVWLNVTTEISRSTLKLESKFNLESSVSVVDFDTVFSRTILPPNLSATASGTACSLRGLRYTAAMQIRRTNYQSSMLECLLCTASQNGTGHSIIFGAALAMWFYVFAFCLCFLCFMFYVFH